MPCTTPSLLRSALVALALTSISTAQVVVANVTQLIAAVDAANRGGAREILLRDGTYQVPSTLVITAAGVTLRSERGDRDAVSIFGGGMSGAVRVLVLVQGSGFTARDMTLGRVNAHAVQVQGELGVSDVRLANLRIQDTFEQMVKISYNASSPSRSQRGVLEGSLLEYTAGIGPQFYIGGIDGHFCKDWSVRGNTFRDISSPSGSLAEHAIHFWSDSEGTVVEGNRIVDCDRGIGFGLGTRGHGTGVIRNNMIWHGKASTPFADVGIGLESASGVDVLHNTVLLDRYPNAIEYRFAATQGGRIADNLCNQAIRARDGAVAALQANVTSAAPAWFVAPAQGDLHLGSAVPTVVDQGVALTAVDRDFDGDPRPLGHGVDVGADEWATVRAAHDAFGSGCGGSSGEPTLRAVQLPWVGHSFELEVGNLAAARGAVLLLGVSRTTLGGGRRLPLDLGAIGMPGCTLFTSVDVNAPLQLQGSVARWRAVVPANAGLIGAALFDQALALAPGANAPGVAVSAAGAARVGG